MLATVVWAVAGSTVWAVWRGSLPERMGVVAILSVAWTLVVPDDLLLTIGVPVIVMSPMARRLTGPKLSLPFLALGVASGVDETA